MPNYDDPSGFSIVRQYQMVQGDPTGETITIAGSALDNLLAAYPGHISGQNRLIYPMGVRLAEFRAFASRPDGTSMADKTFMTTIVGWPKPVARGAPTNVAPPKSPNGIILWRGTWKWGPALTGISGSVNPVTGVTETGRTFYEADTITVPTGEDIAPGRRTYYELFDAGDANGQARACIDVLGLSQLWVYIGTFSDHGASDIARIDIACRLFG